MAQQRKYRDEDWLRSRLRAHASRRDIAEECDVQEETVANWIDRSNITLYREKAWLRERIQNYWTPAQIAADCAVTEGTIERWLDKFEIERPSPPTETEMERHLDTQFDDRNGASKKEEIISLLGKFGPLASKQKIIRVVGCCPDYASRFHWSESERRVTERHRREHESEAIPTRLRRRVLERDNGACVRCGEANGNALEIHHIIPGESIERNLATLCQDCHLAAHGGAYGDGVPYESRQDFWDQWTIVESPE